MKQLINYAAFCAMMCVSVGLFVVGVYLWFAHYIGGAPSPYGYWPEFAGVCALLVALWAAYRMTVQKG